MTQADLDRAVARATGESVTAVRRLGFQLERLSDENAADAVRAALVDDGPRVLDWDDLEAVSLDRYLASVA